MVSDNDIDEKEESLENDSSEENNNNRVESTLNNHSLDEEAPETVDKIEPDKDGLSKVTDETSPLISVVTRNEFYRDGFRIMQRAVIFEAITIISLILLFLMFFAFSQPEDRFFATSLDGKIVQLKPLSDPLVRKETVLNFASESSTQVLTFGFHDYRSRLQEASKNFTKRGWESFLEALGNANYIETITNNRQVISAIPVSPPVIKQEGLQGDVYTWVVEVPLSISIESGSEIASNQILVQMVIARRPKVEYDKGLGIDQWITRSYSSGGDGQ